MPSRAKETPIQHIMSSADNTITILQRNGFCPSAVFLQGLGLAKWAAGRAVTRYVAAASTAHDCIRWRCRCTADDLYPRLGLIRDMLFRTAAPGCRVSHARRSFHAFGFFRDQKCVIGDGAVEFFELRYATHAIITLQIVRFLLNHSRKIGDRFIPLVSPISAKHGIN